MLSVAKLLGVSLAGGVLVGAGTVLWLNATKPDMPAASSGGSVVLRTPEPSAESAAAAQGQSVPVEPSVQGTGPTPAPLRVLGTSSNASPAPEASGGGGDLSAPGPEEFAQYEKYHTSTSVMFGDIRVGSGAVVADGSQVTVNYRGWLTNGQQFDESYSKGEPFSFREGEHRVIGGWENGLLGMKVGGKRRLIVPPALGYGSGGYGPVPGDALLVFDVELVAVQ